MLEDAKKVEIYDNSRQDALDARGVYYHGLLFLKLPIDFEYATYYKCVGIDAPSGILGLRSASVVRDCHIGFSRKGKMFVPPVIKHIDLEGIGFEDILSGVLNFENVILSRSHFHNFNGALNFENCDLSDAKISRTGPLMLNDSQVSKRHKFVETRISIENCDMNGFTFENIDIPTHLYLTDFRDAMIGVTFKRCNFIGSAAWDSGSNTQSAFMFQCDPNSQFIQDNHFEDVFVAQESLKDVRGFHVLLPDCNLSGVDFRDVNPNAYLNLDRCDLQGADFSGVDLVVNTRNVKGSGKLRPCRLFVDADLKDAIFDNVTFGSVDFSYADLRNASFKGASFHNNHGLGLEGDVAIFLGSKFHVDLFANVSIDMMNSRKSSERHYGSRRRRTSYASMRSYSMVFSLSDLSIELLDNLGVSQRSMLDKYQMIDFLNSKDSLQVLGKASDDIENFNRAMVNREEFATQLRDLGYRAASVERTVNLACEIGVAESKQTLNLIFLGKGSRVFGLRTSYSTKRRVFSSFNLPSGFDWSESEILYCMLDTQLDGVNFSNSVLACKFRSLGKSDVWEDNPNVSNCDFSGSTIYAMSLMNYKTLINCSFREVVCHKLVVYASEVKDCVFDQGIYNSIICVPELIENSSFVGAYIAKLTMNASPSSSTTHPIFRNCDFSGAHIIWDLSMLDGRRDFEQEPLFENCFYDDDTRFENLSTEQFEGLVYKRS